MCPPCSFDSHGDKFHNSRGDKHVFEAKHQRTRTPCRRNCILHDLVLFLQVRSTSSVRVGTSCDRRCASLKRLSMAVLVAIGSRRCSGCGAPSQPRHLGENNSSQQRAHLADIASLMFLFTAVSKLYTLLEPCAQDVGPDEHHSQFRGLVCSSTIRGTQKLSV